MTKQRRPRPLNLVDSPLLASGNSEDFADARDRKSFPARAHKITNTTDDRYSVVATRQQHTVAVVARLQHTDRLALLAANERSTGVLLVGPSTFRPLTSGLATNQPKRETETERENYDYARQTQHDQSSAPALGLTNETRSTSGAFHCLHVGQFRRLASLILLAPTRTTFALSARMTTSRLEPKYNATLATIADQKP